MGISWGFGMGIWNGIDPLIMGCKGESNGNLMGLRLGVVMGLDFSGSKFQNIIIGVQQNVD
jgi:hypothetical protein